MSITPVRQTSQVVSLGQALRSPATVQQPVVPTSAPVQPVNALQQAGVQALALANNRNTAIFNLLV